MIGSVALCVPVIVPAQLSVAVGAVNEVIEHCPVISAKDAVLGTGAMRSDIVKLIVIIESQLFAFVNVCVYVPEEVYVCVFKV